MYKLIMHCLCTSTQTYKAPFSFGEGVFLRPMFVLRHLCILYPQIIHAKKLQSKYKYFSKRKSITITYIEFYH